MRKLRVIAALPTLFMATMVHAAGGMTPEDSRHLNGYDTPKIEYNPLTPESPSG